MRAPSCCAIYPMTACTGHEIILLCPVSCPLPLVFWSVAGCCLALCFMPCCFGPVLPYGL